MDLADFASLTDVAWRGRFEIEHGLYVAEGAKTIERALLAGHRLRGVVTEPKWVPQLQALGVDQTLISVHSEPELESITGYHVHRGALAAFERPPAIDPQQVLASSRRLVVIEDVVDHTNIGAIIRSAAAFDIDAVLLTPSCADPLYRRAIKVSMGTVFAVPWARLPWPTGLTVLAEAGFTTLALTPDPSALDIRQLPTAVTSGRWALLLGTEGAGLHRATRDHATLEVRIPMSHGVDSLNVAAAAAVACFECTRGIMPM